ncbi:DUF1707 domain-containing protein [Yinghuangia aomiensis]
MDSDAARPVTDAERERVTGILREQMASGRLALSDYQARLRRVRAAATVGELDAVLRDLPGRRDDGDGEERPHAAASPSAEAAPEQAAGGAKRAGCGGAAAMLVVASAAVCAAAGWTKRAG